MNVSRETKQDLEVYADLLRKWTPKINLISKHTIANLWQRHIEDSLALWPLFPDSAETLTDLGSGGGLPVIPLAILAKHQGKTLRFDAIESDQRKCAFLRKTAIDLDLNLFVHSQRIEQATPRKADVVTARALTALPALLGYCHRHLKDGGIALLPKGATHPDELREALEHWQFDVQTYPSQTDSTAVIFRIEALRRGENKLKS